MSSCTEAMNLSVLYNVSTTVSYSSGQPLHTEVPEAKKFIVFIVSFLIIINNTINLIILKKMTSINSRVKALMANMSISDLLLGIFVCVPAMVAAVVESWPFTTAMCQLTGTITGISISVSLWSLTGISVERFLVVVQPVHINHQPRLRSVQFGIVFVWTFNTLFYAMPVFVKSDMNHYIYQPDMLICGFTWDPVWVLYVASGLYPIGPGLIIVACSYKILMTIRKQSKVQPISSLQPTRVSMRSSCDPSSHTSTLSAPNISGVAVSNSPSDQIDHLTVPGNNTNRNLNLPGARNNYVTYQKSAMINAKMKREAKVSKVMVLTAIAFFLCTSPYLCTSIVDTTQDVYITHWYWFGSLWLLNCNSFINVFIYSTIYPEFRNLFFFYFVPPCFKRNGHP